VKIQIQTHTDTNMIVNGTIVHNINNHNNSNTSWSSHGNNHSNNTTVVRQWLVLLGIVVILPMSFTYFHFHQLLRYEQCTIKRYQYNDNDNDNADNNIERKILDGIYCKGQQHGRNRNNNKELYFVPLVQLFGSSATPPSIATFATTIHTLFNTAPLPLPLVLSNKNEKVGNDPTVTWKLLQSQPFYVSPNEESKITATTDTDTDVSSYGFRRNPNKHNSSSSATAATTRITPPIPMTTYFWLCFNIALYVLYWNNRVNPSTVALNQKVLGNNNHRSDFGRAITGNLAHFEIWHVGMNMMTCSSLGEVLEHPAAIGTIPLMLWTWSFVAFTTICVILLHWWEQRIQLFRNRRNDTTRRRKPFPNMVGFSGILFCWSVYMTLSLEKHQQLCPIPILSTQYFCFETYELFNIPGLKFNWGPIIQLVVLQIVLPRVSFIGHLSGILVGFGWYWNLFPSLQLSQPALSFPLLWFVGKYYLYKSNHFDDNATDDVVEGGGGGISGGNGHILGGGSSSSSSSSGGVSGGVGGYVLGSKKSFTESNSSSSSSNRKKNRVWSEDDTGGDVVDDQQQQQQQQQQQCRQSSPQEILVRTVLHLVRNGFFLHFLWTTWVYRSQTPFHNSIILSELLMTLLFAVFVRAVTTTKTTTSTSGTSSCAAEMKKKKKNIMTLTTIATTSTTKTTTTNPFHSIGIVGRAYIAFVTVIIITDAMTIGGWFATRVLWQSLSLSLSSENNASGLLSSFLISFSSSSSSSSSSTEGWTMALFLFVTRFGLWIVSISLVCYLLDRHNELQHCGNRSSTNNNDTIAGIDNTNDDNDNNEDGIWFPFFGLFLIHPCRSLGKTMIEHRWSSSISNRITSHSSWSSTAAATMAAAMNSNSNTDTGGGFLTMTTSAADSRSVSSRKGRNRSTNSLSISERRANILSSRGGGGGASGHNSVATTTTTTTTTTTMAVTKRGDDSDQGEASPSSLSSSTVTSTPSSMAAISNIV